MADCSKAELTKRISAYENPLCVAPLQPYKGFGLIQRREAISSNAHRTLPLHQGINRFNCPRCCADNLWGSAKVTPKSLTPFLVAGSRFDAALSSGVSKSGAVEGQAGLTKGCRGFILVLPLQELSELWKLRYKSIVGNPSGLMSYMLSCSFCLAVGGAEMWKGSAPLGVIRGLWDNRELTWPTLLMRGAMALELNSEKPWGLLKLGHKMGVHWEL